MTAAEVGRWVEARRERQRLRWRESSQQAALVLAHLCSTQINMFRKKGSSPVRAKKLFRSFYYQLTGESPRSDAEEALLDECYLESKERARVAREARELEAKKLAEIEAVDGSS